MSKREAKRSESSDSKHVVIRLPDKLRKMDDTIQIRDLGTQLSKILYGGKSLTTGPNGVLGVAQQISKKTIKHAKSTFTFRGRLL